MKNYEMTGVSSDNSYKEHERQPDFTGKCTIAGKEYRMAGWRRVGSTGEFISWKFSEPLPPKTGGSVGNTNPKPVEVPKVNEDTLPF